MTYEFASLGLPYVCVRCILEALFATGTHNGPLVGYLTAKIALEVFAAYPYVLGPQPILGEVFVYRPRFEVTWVRR